jgi:hypothetical protein
LAATHVLLFFHLLGAVCFFAGAALAGTLQLAAIRRERPSEILALLRLTRVGVALVGTGALLTLGFGIALAEHEGFGLSPAWIQAALGLWAAGMARTAAGRRGMPATSRSGSRWTATSRARSCARCSRRAFRSGPATRAG